MPRQNFLSSDFFVSTSEAAAKAALLSIPEHLPNIKLVKENSLIQTMRFLYQHHDKTSDNYMDVSILPLNDQYVRFCLHASYSNGQAFHSDPAISNALFQFEKAVHAAISNDFSLIDATPAAKSKKNQSLFLNTVLSLLSMVFLWKKLTP
jgi:hypothetical protein